MRKRNITIEIIPLIQLDRNNIVEDKDVLINKITNLNINYDKSNLWLFDIHYLTKLYMVDDFKNKRVYLTNILNFIVDRLNHQKMKSNISDVFELRRKELVKIFSSKTYRTYMRILVETGILIPVKYKCGNYFIHNEYKPRQFRFSKDFLNANEIALLMISSNENKKRKLIIDPLLERRLNDQDPRIISSMNRFKIDTEGSIKAEIEHYYKEDNSVNSLINRINTIFRFMDKRTIKEGNKSGRLYTSITELSRVSREFLIPKMYEIDLSNSQPAILSNIFIENNMDFDPNFILDTENGLLYQRFYGLYIDKINHSNIRDITKRNLYKNILFGFNERSIINKKFKELYPITWEYIKSIGKDNVKKIYGKKENGGFGVLNEDEVKNNKNLASILQRKESDIFLNLRPKKSKFYATIHDSILVDYIGDIPQLKEDIKEKFKIKIKLK